jgi:hypothetical protein
MKDQQQLLFNHSPAAQSTPVAANKGLPERVLKITLLASAAIPSLTAALIFLWATGGEVLLEKPYRFSTFLGKRLGDIKNAEIEASLAKEAEKQDALAAANGLVELRKGCVNARNQAAQQVYTMCIQQGGFLTGCEFQRKEVLQLPCDHFQGSELSTKFPGVQGGNHD